MGFDNANVTGNTRYYLAKTNQPFFFSKAAKLDPKSGTTLVMLGLCEFELHKVHSGQLTAAISLSALHLRASDSPVPLIGHAECLAAEKQFERARSEYSSLVQSNSDFPNIHYAFGRLQIAAALYQGDSAAGLPYAEAAVKLGPNIPLGHYLVGLLLEDTGQDARAIPELELARKSFPVEAGVYYALGKAYAHTGRAQEAAKARAEFIRLKDQVSPSVLPQR